MRRMFNPKVNTIYVDLDDVLVDFNAFVFDNLGRYFDNHVTNLEENDNEMWLFLKNVSHMYLNLNPTPYARELWDHIVASGVNVEILTAIPRRHYIAEAEQDKRDWVAKHLGADVKVNIGPYSADKWKWAKPSDILIDDREDNIQQWINDGFGIGIIHYKNDPLCHIDTMNRVTAVVTEQSRFHN